MASIAVATDFTSASLQLSCRPPVKDGSCGWSQPALVHHVFLRMRAMKRRGSQANLLRTWAEARPIVSRRCALWALVAYSARLKADRGQTQQLRTSRAAAAFPPRWGLLRSVLRDRPAGGPARAGPASCSRVEQRDGGKAVGAFSPSTYANDIWRARNCTVPASRARTTF
eukprot:SAG31_NODE_3301_length_4442_cov_17.276076_6_plen_170_part_00